MAKERIEQSPEATQARRDLTKVSGEMALALRLSQPVFVAIMSMNEDLTEVRRMGYCTQSGLSGYVRSSEISDLSCLFLASYAIKWLP